MGRGLLPPKAPIVTLMRSRKRFNCEYHIVYNKQKKAKGLYRHTQLTAQQVV